MAREPKTRPTGASVEAFLDAVEHAGRREDGRTVAGMLAEVSGETPVMWGPSIVGYGSYRGPTGDWPLIGFSPRKANLVLYIMKGFAGSEDLLARLGKHRTGGACLYLNRLTDIDEAILRQLAAESVAYMRRKYAV
ncbi:MAG TPA: DUF1801 domain-containing protein [Caulobacter sp.]|nr:DUF1801 domain-containing protein [Caulobacter sp.]